MSSPEQVTAVVEPVVMAAGCDLEAVEVRAAGRRQLVRVLIDADGGVSLEKVSELSRAVSAAMDAADSRLGFGAYVLEVSSPGVDRPLTRARHFRRAIGRLVSVATKSGEQFAGRIVSCDADAVTFEGEFGERTIDVAGIATAKVQVEFNPRGPARAAAGAGLTSGGTSDKSGDGADASDDSEDECADDGAYDVDDDEYADDGAYDVDEDEYADAADLDETDDTADGALDTAADPNAAPTTSPTSNEKQG